MKPTLGKYIALVRSFWNDTDGVILPIVTMMLVAIVGISMLALDGARYVNLHTQLQKGADALALAGAAELNRLPDSVCRATTAINNYIANVYGPSSGQNIIATNIRFLSSLPSNDNAPISNANLVPNTSPDPDCTHGTTVQFVEVTVGLVSLPTILPASLFGGTNLMTAGAQAVAGYDQVVCFFSPLYICNPFETAGMTYERGTAALQQADSDPSIKRRLIKLMNTDTYNPGNFGFLDSPLGNGASAVRQGVGSVSPAVCFQQSKVSTKPGNMANVADAFNVRFDIYESTMKGDKNDPNYRPALNVRKGYVPGGGTCNSNPAGGNQYPPGDSTAMGLPLDSSWPNMGGRMGNGNWNCSQYWKVNFKNVGPVPTNCANGTWSRYQMYRYEIDNNLVSHKAPAPAAGETGGPTCNTNGLSNTPDRRIVYGAIVNCLCLQNGDGCFPGAPNLNGNTPNIPAAGFGKFFMTVPNTTGVLYAEFSGLVKPQDNLLFNVVQLYR